MSCGEEKTKSSGESKSEVETTTIESLPDDLRCHILSFLPTRDAAATSLLSKRWKPLWLSLRSFEFNNRYYFTDFGKFSDFVIPFLSSQHSVQSLRLTCHCCDPFDVVDVNHLLYRVRLQGIQELHLTLFTYSTILPNGFCKNLATLELYHASLNYFSCVDFPLIKSLSLIFVKFESHAVMFKFVCGCPNLEYLDARHLTVLSRDIPPPAEEIAEALPKLVRAKINHFSILCPVLGNARFLCIQMNLSDRVNIPTFHNLSHVDLTSPREYIDCNVMWNWFAQMLHNCPKLQNLTISKEHAYTHAIGKCHWKDQETVPECLSSQLRTFKFKSYNGSGCEVQFAKYIMQNSKVLQNMTIHTKAIDLKHQMLETFSLCPRGSANCILHFDITSSQVEDSWRLLYDLSVMYVITSSVNIVNYNCDLVSMQTAAAAR